MENFVASPIKHIFFDLDHTLWDFDKNAKETLLELYELHQLANLGLECANTFIERYTHNNHQLWAKYHLGEIDKETLRAQRFRQTFIELGIHPDRVPHQFEDDYVNTSPTKTNLFEGTKEVLNYLKDKYKLHIISNGFKETTLTKMRVCSLNPYFQNVIISEDVGANKPSPKIFSHALHLAKAQKHECIMIGDSLEADIKGAQDYGIPAIFFNPTKIEAPQYANFQIHELKELLKYF